MYFALSDNAPFGLNPAARFFCETGRTQKDESESAKSRLVS